MSDGVVTEQEVVAWLESLPGVVVETVAAGSDAPQIAWGDSFAYDPVSAALPSDRRRPFATVVTKNYPGFDESSQLDRAGVFRVNIDVGRERFTELVGYPPSQHTHRAPDVDPATVDALIPHPQYGQQGWVAVVSPGGRTSELVRDLLRDACERAKAHHRPTAARTGEGTAAGDGER